ncbi:DUF4177 domain-containing protein [Bacillus cereus group sp. BfR-BA-01309]|uniref:DUF4177 domain-containing protein n=1 Tax=Bacillus cereus group sp. BfR-BA-01309 TaxID=2920286 RepID=UPI001F59F975|nr:DUF4177 domain-containing protein [Bacillus cereus group sp. BfR-BA-01309]
MKKFEYRMIDFQKLLKPDGVDIDVSKLNNLLYEGWNLVMINSGECVFRREVS